MGIAFEETDIGRKVDFELRDKSRISLRVVESLSSDRITIISGRGNQEYGALCRVLQTPGHLPAYLSHFCLVQSHIGDLGTVAQQCSVSIGQRDCLRRSEERRVGKEC